jgi:hypothetical protein
MHQPIDDDDPTPNTSEGYNAYYGITKESAPGTPVAPSDYYRLLQRAREHAFQQVFGTQDTPEAGPPAPMPMPTLERLIDELGVAHALAIEGMRSAHRMSGCFADDCNILTLAEQRRLQFLLWCQRHEER